MDLDELGGEGESKALAYRAIVAREPDADGVLVKIPTVDLKHLFGPCKFDGTLEVGDAVLVVFTDEGDPWVAAGGSVLPADGSVTNPMLADNAVTLSKMADDSVGTNELVDNAATKPYSVVGTTSDPPETSTANPPTVLLPEMTITADFGGGPLLLFFTGSFSNTAGNVTRIRYRDVTAGADIGVNRSINTSIGVIPHVYLYTPPAAGTRTIRVNWSTSAGTAFATGTNRAFVILELRR